MIKYLLAALICCFIGITSAKAYEVPSTEQVRLEKYFCSLVDKTANGEVTWQEAPGLAAQAFEFTVGTNITTNATVFSSVSYLSLTIIIGDKRLTYYGNTCMSQLYDAILKQKYKSIEIYALDNFLNTVEQKDAQKK